MALHAVVAGMPTLYAAMRTGLVVASGAAGDWQRAVRLADRDLECVAANPVRPNRAFVGTFDAGLWRSTDGGDTFARVGDWLPDAVTSVAVSPHDPDVVWAGTEPSRVYRSADGGDTWTERPGLAGLDSSDRWSFPPRPDTHHVRWLEPHPGDPDTLYVSIEAGAFLRTRDGGGTWLDRPEGARRDNHTLATHPEDPDRVWSAAGDGYAESHDAGDTWTYPQDGLDHRYCWSLALDPADPDTVVLSAASGAGSAHGSNGESYLYRRTDGADWTRVDDGIPTGEGVRRYVLASGTDPGEVYACGDRGPFRSTDGGATWTALALDWPAAVAGEPCQGLAVVG
jgi:photosystem II stability/assembly factor-like uncharacterized protein